MKIRIKVNQPACTHQALTLKGIDLKRSRERYICNACGKPIVRTLKRPCHSSQDTFNARRSPGLGDTSYMVLLRDARITLLAQEISNITKLIAS
jgi:transposase-like protein